MMKTQKLFTALLLFVITACGSHQSNQPSKDVHMNRLAQEQSPYLLQHASNPVDWYPWGDEAFEKAKRENKPIFLSIGYSTCHWCHVMEHESFEDEEVAALLNEHYICIKVDREERPDIDHVYMSVCQAMTGSGGWPLTIVMTPDKEPFYAGTYFPKYDRGRRPGMMTLLPSISEAWESKQDDIQQTIAQISQYLKESNSLSGSQLPDESIIGSTFEQLSNRFDLDKGGFSKAPKFPSPHNLIFLLRYFHETNDSFALEMVETTLQNMRKGGIYDQIGFGFHRYSTDQNWLVPHFEKMLYDQAMILWAYTEAFHITQNPIYQRTAEEIITYVLRDMTHDEGGFYSAEDADSEGEEGKFYVWSEEELQNILSSHQFELAKDWFKTKADGNILHLNSFDPFAKPEYDDVRQVLFDHREKRIHPLKDDKILTDWNGLMIGALAKAGMVFGDESIIQSAEKSAKFILANLQEKDGRLLKRYRNGEADLPAHLDDYVFMVFGLLQIHAATQNSTYLVQAVELAEIMVEDFHDESNGGFFLNGDHSEKLLVRPKTGYDGAIPSGNSLSVHILYRLAKLTGDVKWSQVADGVLKVFNTQMTGSPSGFTSMVTGYMTAINSPKEVVIVGDRNDPETMNVWKIITKDYSPSTVVLLKYINDEELVKKASWISAHNMIENKPTIYVCENFACKHPTTDIQIALDYLRE